MKTIRIDKGILFLLVICLIGACKTTAHLILIPEQKAVKIASGNQAITLELMNTHTSVATEQVKSEYYARVMAVILNADVAQLIAYETSNAHTTSLTYRFWKKK